MTKFYLLLPFLKKKSEKRNGNAFNEDEHRLVLLCSSSIEEAFAELDTGPRGLSEK